jgi:uncharacterized protein YutE (UPF0331/DUF86 family)
MTNSQTIAELDKAREAIVRRTIADMLDHYGGDELIQILSEAMSDYAHHIARREGLYERAAALGVMVRYLEGLDKFLANYDPTAE